ANKFFDEEQPWITLKQNIEKCRQTLFTCVQIIANLSILLEPFLPFSSSKIRSMLHIESTGWKYTEVPFDQIIEDVNILFERIDKKRIQEEIENMKRVN
ncbi:MAG: methionine--tRNA ligase, partial [Clostridiaceae bacterium]|nr:methionine--tRNA ligase [Clostridiaceae bacterium]